MIKAMVALQVALRPEIERLREARQTCSGVTEPNA